MITFFKGWLVQILAVTILVIIIQLILPDNSNKKYINMVLGMLVILTIISPALKVLGNPESDIASKIYSQIEEKAEMNNIAGDADEISKKQNEYILSQVKSKSEAELKKYIDNMGYKVKKVEMVMDGTYNLKLVKIELDSTTKVNNSDIRKISDNISQEFDIELSSINITANS